MIAVDTNLLVYAHRTDSVFFKKAKTSLQDLVQGTRLWGIPWPCIHEFYAIVTHPRIYKPATPQGKALSQLEALLESPSLRLLTETENYWPVLRKLATLGNVMGPRIHDARIAAICLANDIDVLWSADRDFGRFEGIEIHNPLI